MKRQIQQPAAVSHTIQSKPKAAKQADMHTVLQKYAVAQRVEMPEEDELLQGKFETAPLKNGDSLLESGELRMEKGAIQMQARNAARKLLRDNVGKKNISEREAGTVHGLQVSMGKNPQSHHHPTTLRKDVAESLYPWLDRTKDTEDPVQLKSKITHTAKNETGIPNSIKTNFENLSGFSFDDVRVHYNSDKPAQLQALAYTQGNEVHIAPGQEKHLGHELGHVVQQKQGRVQPTMQLQGVNVNDNEGLEKEADVMGGKAVQMRNGEKLEEEPVQMMAGNVIQCVSHCFEDGSYITFDERCPGFSPDGKELWHLSFGTGTDGDYSHITKDGDRDHYFIKSLSDRPLVGVKAWTERPKTQRRKLKTDHEYEDLPDNVKFFVNAYIDILMASTEERMMEMIQELDS